MPYYIYRIRPPLQLEPIDVHPDYQGARRLARGLREAQSQDDPSKVRLIFAQTASEAERLLTTPREAPPNGDD